MATTTKTFLENTSFLLYSICLGLLAFHEYKNQEYNWDMLPYMSVILLNDNDNMNDVHDSVYNIVKRQVPANDYQLLINGNVPMRKRSVESADYFRQQLPFYVVKPLYTKIAYWFYQLGVPLTNATVLPSVLSYFFIGITIFVWLKKYVNHFESFLLGLMTMLCRPFISAGHISTPDCLSQLILLCAFYCLLERKPLTIVFALLASSIFVRLDNIIPALAVLIFLKSTDKLNRQLSLKQSFLIALVFCISYFLVSFNVKPFGWSVLYYPTFVSHLNATYNSGLLFSFSNYFSVARSQIVGSIAFSDLVLFMLLGLMVFINNKSIQIRNFSPEQLFVLVIFLIIISRFILQPVIGDRFYIAYYATILVLMVKRLFLKYNVHATI